MNNPHDPQAPSDTDDQDEKAPASGAIWKVLLPLVCLALLLFGIFGANWIGSTAENAVGRVIGQAFVFGLLFHFLVARRYTGLPWGAPWVEIRPGSSIMIHLNK